MQAFSQLFSRKFHVFFSVSWSFNYQAYTVLYQANTRVYQAGNGWLPAW